MPSGSLLCVSLCSESREVRIISCPLIVRRVHYATLNCHRNYEQKSYVIRTRKHETGYVFHHFIDRNIDMKRTNAIRHYFYPYLRKSQSQKKHTRKQKTNKTIAKKKMKINGRIHHKQKKRRKKERKDSHCLSLQIRKNVYEQLNFLQL